MTTNNTNYDGEGLLSAIANATDAADRVAGCLAGLFTFTDRGDFVGAKACIRLLMGTRGHVGFAGQLWGSYPAARFLLVCDETKIEWKGRLVGAHEATRELACECVCTLPTADEADNQDWPTLKESIDQLRQRIDRAIDITDSELREMVKHEAELSANRLIFPAKHISNTINTENQTNWPKQVSVARGLGKERYEVKRLIDCGKLQTNSLTGHNCRIDPTSLIRYCEQEGIAYNEK